MVEEIGIVLSTSGNMAKVEIQKTSACDACPTAKVCHPAGGGMIMEVSNPVGAVVGDKVNVGIEAQIYLKASFIVYAIPVILLIAGAIFGKNWAEETGRAAESDMWAAIIGFGFLVVSLVIIRLWGSKIEKKKKYIPVIMEILR
ncbi:MAG: SoxR reducing system RseC family protein [Nitrospirota bacterium]